MGDMISYELGFDQYVIHLVDLLGEHLVYKSLVGHTSNFETKWQDIIII